ncbi:MAG: acylneuraminate cytidylyltransferase family protein [Candidatus Omnitrophota bacterium]
MNILCVIPARGGSKGLKDKNIIPVCGKPLIGYTIEAALGSKLVNRITVSTDDNKIKKAAFGYGIQVIERPKKYSTDSAPIEEALRHAIRHLERNYNYSPEIVVLLQANVPIRKSGQIDIVINKLLSSRADSAVTVYAVNQLPQWMKTMNKAGFLSPLLPGIKSYRRQDIEPLYLLDGAIVAMRTETLMGTEGKKGVHVFMGDRVVGVIQERIYSLEVDDKDDLDLVNFYLDKRGRVR